MKKISINLKFTLLLFGLLLINIINAQCPYIVTHTSGIQIINNVSVEITSSGVVTAYYFTNCPEAGPYTVGRDNPGLNGNGSYTFQLSPSVDSLSVNLRAINNDSIHKEIIKLFVNGQRYSVPSAATDTACNEPLAILTDSGNITGRLNEPGSGWKNLTIPGPITSLTIMDSIVFGAPNGVLFSLSICNPIPTSTLHQNEIDFKIFPNPANEKITITGLKHEKVKIKIYNNLGGIVYASSIGHTNELEIDVSPFKKGLYFFTIERKGKIENKKFIIE